MKKTFLLKTMLLLCALVVGGSAWADDVFVKITSTSGLETSAQYLLVYENGTSSKALGAISTTSTKYGTGVDVSISNDQITISNQAVAELTLGGSSSEGWTFKSSLDNNYLYWSSGNSLTTNSTASLYALSYDNDGVLTMTTSNGARYMRYNTTSPRFAMYAPNAQGDLTGVSVALYKKLAVSTPVLNPAGGTYSTAQSVTISCATEGATIYYTTNGNNPTENDIRYSSAISVTTTKTIKAKAFKSDMPASSVATATYTIKPTKPTITASGSSVTISGDNGCTFYYVTYTDPESPLTPSSQSTQYNGTLNLTEDCYIKAIAYDTYGNASDVTSAFSFKYIPLAPKNINSNYFEKVTDVNDLENGDAILIVNEEKGKTISTTQNDNNRGVEAVTITDGIIAGISENVQKLVLVKGTETIENVETTVFYFYTGVTGYLYAASSSKNYLRTEATPDNNARATIVLSNDNNKNATITFTGSSTHNLLQYNSSNSIFSAYDNAQKDVQIYKEIPYTAPITAAGWATYAPAYAVEFQEGTNAYIVSGANTTTATLQQVTSVPANTPVLLQGTDGTATDAAMSVLISSTTNVSGNCLHVSTGTNPDGNMYVLAKPNDEGENTYPVGFYLWDKTNGGNLPAGKIYLQLSDETRSFIALPGEETGISATLMNNEQRINNNVYDLQGRPVAQPTKGLYIVNGKKLIIK